MIDGILILLSALSAGYFLIITIYSGIGTSFSFIWLFSVPCACFYPTAGGITPETWSGFPDGCRFLWSPPVSRAL